MPIQSKQPSELVWVRLCLRMLERLDKPGGGSTHRIDGVVHAIARRFWVRGQLAYFRRQCYRHNKSAETIRGWSNTFLLLPVLVLVPTLICLILSNAAVHWYGIDMQRVILVLLGLMPGIAAAVAGYSEQLALKAQARQYDRMRMLFERADRLLPESLDAISPAQASALYGELGCEAMKENAEWVAIYRQRPIQPLR